MDENLGCDLSNESFLVILWHGNIILLRSYLKNFMAFFTTLICFVSFCIIFLKVKFFHVNLCFQKEKLWENVAFTAMAILVYFTSLTLTLMYMQITLNSVDFAGDKYIAFDFSDASHFGVPWLFWLSRVCKLRFTLFIPKFSCRKIMRNAVTE